MVQAAGSRDQVKQELLAFAQQHLNNWDNYADREFRSNDLGFEFTSRQTEENGLTVTVSKSVVPGFTLENHRAFRENLPT